MKDKALEAQILHLADRAGIEGGRVFEVAKSEDTKAINAYVNGFGATKRIVLWDTILKALDRPQLMIVMGHEMAHYVLGHVWRLIGMGVATILLLLYAVYRISGALIDRYSARFGFTTLADVASLPLILLVPAWCRSSPIRSRWPIRATSNTRPTVSRSSSRTTITPPPRRS